LGFSIICSTDKNKLFCDSNAGSRKQQHLVRLFPELRHTSICRLPFARNSIAPVEMTGSRAVKKINPAGQPTSRHANGLKLNSNDGKLFFVVPTECICFIAMAANRRQNVSARAHTSMSTDSTCILLV
jgi:hypothetical protein